jgi:hypothetical protein
LKTLIENKVAYIVPGRTTEFFSEITLAKHLKIGIFSGD